MTDVYFNQGDTSSSEPVEVEVADKGPKTAQDVDIEPAFTLYKSAKNKSYIADYLGLQDDYNQEAYTEELETIEDYFKGKVEDGSMENSTEAVKDLLKKAEKELKLEKSERMVVRIQKLIAYLKFRQDVDGVIANNKKYGYKD